MKDSVDRLDEADLVGEEGRDENADVYEPLVGEPGRAVPDETKEGVAEDRVGEEGGREVMDVIDGELRDCIVVDLSRLSLVSHGQDITVNPRLTWHKTRHSVEEASRRWA